MEIEALISKIKNIYPILMDFIDETDDSDVEFTNLIEIITEKEILKNQEEVRLLFQLISIITDNHHRTSDFFDKIEKIFQYLIKDIPSPISNFIPNYTNYNERILFLLFEKGFVKPDKSFLDQYLQVKTSTKTLKQLYSKNEINNMYKNNPYSPNILFFHYKNTYQN